MTVINNISAANVGRLSAVQATKLARADSTADDIPSATSITELVASLELPDLPLSQRGISIDTLLSAISDEDRRNSIQQAVDSIEKKGEDLKASSEKKLAALKEKLEELKNQSFWDGFCKVFKVIGMIVGAIAAAATTAVGIMTGNPLLIGAGAVGLLMVGDSLLSTLTDGKVSISAGFEKLGKAFGMSDEAAKWFAFGMQMAIVVATTVVSFGAAAGSSGAGISQAAETGAKTALDALSKISAVSEMANGVTTVGQGVGSIALAVVSYSIAKLEAKSVDIDAILEQLRNQMKMEQDLIEAEMNAADKLMSAVKDIIEDCSQTATAVLTASPSAA